VIDWVNGTFNKVFPADATCYSPAKSPMDAVHESDVQGLPGGVEVLNIPAIFGKNDEAVEYESVRPWRTCWHYSPCPV